MKWIKIEFRKETAVSVPIYSSPSFLKIMDLGEWPSLLGLLRYFSFLEKKKVSKTSWPLSEDSYH